jgi:hypothetical protein|nr:MAG TPA: hypothetical protein [Caudoviricetes sp.]
MIAEDPETPKRERKPSVEVVSPSREEPIVVEAVEKTTGETVVDQPKSDNVIETESRPVVPKPRESNPRSSASPKRNETAEFDLNSSLADHRQAILEFSAEYVITKQLPSFLVMLSTVFNELESDHNIKGSKGKS